MPEIENALTRQGRRTFLRWQAAAALAALGLDRLSHGDEPADAGAPSALRVRVWCEGTAPRSVYPEDIDGTVAAALHADASIHVTTARLEQPDAGLPDAVLDQTDVLIWWGRLRHDDLPEARAEAIAARVRAGRLGLIALHSSYASKPFRALMGKPCEPRMWRDEGSPERVAVASPDHPIARGVGPFVIPRTQLFSEPFEIPEPETVVFVSSWETGESFRSGVTWTVDKGRVAYLRTADDSFPVLFHPSVRQVLLNATRWAGRRV